MHSFSAVLWCNVVKITLVLRFAVIQSNRTLISVLISVNHITIKHAKLIHAINIIRQLVILAQLLEQWTGDPEAGALVPRLNHLISGCLRNSYRFPLLSQMYAKLLNFCFVVQAKKSMRKFSKSLFALICR